LLKRTDATHFLFTAAIQTATRTAKQVSVGIAATFEMMIGSGKESRREGLRWRTGFSIS
jgi:hypothetical protein